MSESAKSATIKKERKSTTFMKRRFILLFGDCMGNVSRICSGLHIDRQTYYNWMKDDPVFAQTIENESEALIDYVESKLFDAINRKDTTAIIFFLKTKGKKRGYVERQEVTGAEGRPLTEKLIVEVVHVKNGPAKAGGNGDGDNGHKP